MKRWGFLTAGLYLIALVALGFPVILAAFWPDKTMAGPPFLDDVQHAGAPAIVATAILLLWAVWGIVFHRRTRSDSPEALVRRAGSWLLRGSITELIVAVSCHVIVSKQR